MVKKLTLPERRINQQAIDILRAALEDAEAGEITEVLLVARKRGVYESAWSGVENLQELIGALEVLKARQVLRVTGGDE